MKNFFEDYGESLINNFTAIILAIVICSFIAIPCLISEKRNIEKEITLKEIEVYGERRKKDE